MWQNLLKNPEHQLLLFMLIFTRFMLMSLFLPFLGARLLPSIIRVALVCILSLVTLGYLPQTPTFTGPYLWLFLKEAALGFLIGFTASLIFYCYQLTGELLDLVRGASSTRMLIPELEHQSSPLGLLFFQLSLVIFISLGLHREFLRQAFESFHHFPPIESAPNINYQATLGALSLLWEAAVSLALPVIFTCFLLDLAFGFLNRIAPQINAYFLSLPIKTIGGLMMVFLSLPMVIDDFWATHEKLLAVLKALWG